MSHKQSGRTCTSDVHLNKIAWIGQILAIDVLSKVFPVVLNVNQQEFRGTGVMIHGMQLVRHVFVK